MIKLTPTNYISLEREFNGEYDSFKHRKILVYNLFCEIFKFSRNMDTLKISQNLLSSKYVVKQTTVYWESPDRML